MSDTLLLQRTGMIPTPLFFPRRVPIWAIIIFSVSFAFAISPNLVYVYGIHNDYEMLTFKNHGFLFHEAEHLFSIARPVGALLANLTLLPAESIADFRWTRLFSVATVCFMGFQMMSICVHRLRVDPLSALVISMVAFLVPAFIYSVLNAPAWAVHLLPVLIAFFAYELLSRSNIQAIPFLAVVRSRNLRDLWRQFCAYCTLRSVGVACLVLQVAFYDFPPNALVMAAFPVVVMWFSTAPASYRALIAVRDIAFIAGNLAVYAVSAKLLYLPIVSLVTYRNSEAWRHSDLTKFDQRIAATYNYKFNFDPDIIVGRLREIGRVSGNLWFLPQAEAHIVVGLVMVVAFAVLVGRWLLIAPRDRAALHFGILAPAITAVAMLLAGAAALGAGGAFISYRTVPVCTMIVAILFVYVIGSLSRLIGTAIGRSPGAGAIAAGASMLMTAGAAVAGNFEMNYLTMRLARNETAYIEGIIRKAIDDHSDAVIILDPRPFSLPEDHPMVYDQSGHAIPPYLLSCFSGVCLQNGAIVTILAEQLGIPRGRLKVFAMRGDEPIPDASCTMLTDPNYAIPAGTSDKVAGTIKYMRGLGRITCVNYSLAWHDVGRTPEEAGARGPDSGAKKAVAADPAEGSDLQGLRPRRGR
jgi:hypothetical protein